MASPLSLEEPRSGVSKDGPRASWFETREDALLTMRGGCCAPSHTFSNGRSTFGRLSSHSGTGKFLARMKAGLNSFD